MRANEMNPRDCLPWIGWTVVLLTAVVHGWCITRLGERIAVLEAKAATSEARP